LSFVYALALAHILSRVGALILSFKRIRFSGLLALAIVNAITQVFLGWLVLWNFRDVRQWRLVDIAGQFLLAVLCYFLCVFAVPVQAEPAGDAPIDMLALYNERRWPFYATALMLYLLAIVTNATLLNSPDQALLTRMNEISAVSIVPLIVPLSTKSSWAQWVGGTGMLAFAVIFMIQFSGTLG
jgi:hypothetical protein